MRAPNISAVAVAAILLIGSAGCGRSVSDDTPPTSSDPAPTQENEGTTSSMVSMGCTDGGRYLLTADGIEVTKNPDRSIKVIGAFEAEQPDQRVSLYVAPNGDPEEVPLPVDDPPNAYGTLFLRDPTDGVILVTTAAIDTVAAADTFLAGPYNSGFVEANRGELALTATYVKNFHGRPQVSYFIDGEEQIEEIANTSAIVTFDPTQAMVALGHQPISRAIEPIQCNFGMVL